MHALCTACKYTATHACIPHTLHAHRNTSMHTAHPCTHTATHACTPQHACMHSAMHTCALRPLHAQQTSFNLPKIALLDKQLYHYD
eukprot:350353-Chlamydomonas_euryale.AAC.2